MAESELLLAFDLGSTHLKSGLFSLDGKMLDFSSHPLVVQQVKGVRWVIPDQFFTSIRNMTLDLTKKIDPSRICGIGICSMAETGLLIDRKDLSPVSWIVPWFERSNEEQVELIRGGSLVEEVFLWSGTYVTYKCPLAKILWLKKHFSISMQNSMWLSAADYLALILTSQTATDFSLAGRTLAYDINQKIWNRDWLKEWGMEETMFPSVLPAGKMMGTTSPYCRQTLGLPAGIPVTIAGHDHVCAAASLSANSLDSMVDSIGTAETLIGSLPDKPLKELEFQSGLSFGIHILPGMKYWMGALSTSGGAIEWVRSMFAPQMAYDQIEREIRSLPEGPGNLIFIPYLSGSGAPHSNPDAAGAWLGLKNEHTRAYLIKAVVEGIACEMEFVRRAVKSAGLLRSDRIIITGGGAQNKSLLKIKADISGCTLSVNPISESALIGAAMAAGLAAGSFQTFESAATVLLPEGEEIINPDGVISPVYQRYYEQLYLPAMQFTMRFSNSMNRERSEE